MTTFVSAHATGDDWAQVAKSCADRLAPLPEDGNLGFLYVTDSLAEDVSSILTFLRQVTGIEEWVGSVGMGVLSGAHELHEGAAAAVMVAALPEGSFSVFPAVRQDIGQISEETRDWLDHGAAPFAVVHGDPYNGQTPALLGDLAEHTSGFLVGALTASRGQAQQVAGDVTSGGVSGVLFAPEVEVATGLSQGCTPVAEPRIITEAQNNIIISIDGEPALEIMKRDMGELLARDLNRAAGYIHPAFPVEGSDTRDYLVRDLMAVDPQRGWIVVGGDITAGERIMFVRRDPKSAEQDLAEMVEGLKSRLPSAPKGGLYFSCVARGPHMFGTPGREMELITERLGDFPLVGFYAAGEISNARLYGYTGVLALFL